MDFYQLKTLIFGNSYIPPFYYVVLKNLASRKTDQYLKTNCDVTRTLAF